MFFYQISTLTAEIDIINSTVNSTGKPAADVRPGAGDDVFIGDKATTQVADRIDGGNGNDTFEFVGANTAHGTLVLPTLKSVENLILTSNDSSAIDVSTIEGLKTLTLDKHDIKTNNVTVILAGQAVTVKAPIVNAAGSDTVTFASATDTVLDLTVDNIAKPAASGVTTFDISGTKVATLDLTAMGKDSVFTLTNTGTALKTLNIDGTGKVEIASTLTTITTVNAANNKGGVDITLAGSDLKFTGGAGDDRLDLGAVANLTKADVLDFGAGSADTLTLNAATFTDPQVKLINAAKGLDILELKGDALGAGSGAVIDANDFTFNTFMISTAATGASGGSAANVENVTAAKAGAEFTGIASDGSDTIILAASLTGGAGDAGTVSAHGASGLSLSVLNGGGMNDIINLKIMNADVTLKGGASESDGGNTANSGVGLDASAFETLNINVAKALTVVTGKTSPADTDTDTLVSSHAKLNITGKGDVDLGTVSNKVGVADDQNNLTVDAHGLEGSLTVVTGAGIDHITAGTKGSFMAGGKGGDIITCGDGVDRVEVKIGDSGTLDGTTFKGVDKVSGFKAGTGGDVLDFVDAYAPTATGAATYTEMTPTGNTAISNATTLKAAVDAAAKAVNVADSWTAFAWHDTTYALYEKSTNKDAWDATDHVLVELSGVDVSALVATNFSDLA